MRYGLDTRPGGIDIGAEIGVDDTKGCRGKALGGEVNMAASQWGRSGKEHCLLQGPFCKVRLDRGVVFDHGVEVR